MAEGEKGGKKSGAWFLVVCAKDLRRTKVTKSFFSRAGASRRNDLRKRGTKCVRIGRQAALLCESPTRQSSGRHLRAINRNTNGRKAPVTVCAGRDGVDASEGVGRSPPPAFAHAAGESPQLESRRRVPNADVVQRGVDDDWVERRVPVVGRRKEGDDGGWWAKFARICCVVPIVGKDFCKFFR
jgi:hypothetical protein